MSSISESSRLLPERIPGLRRAETAPSARFAVEEQARRRPGALALSAGARRLTFGELDALAETFAAELADTGVSADRPVAIVLADPGDRAVASLAAWKAGAAYLPLDPDAPRSRLAFMVRDCAAPLVVAEDEATWLELGAPVIPFRRDRPARAGGRRPEPDGSSGLAYVIYTSGSTGTPKGVEIEHGSLSNLIAWHRRAFGVGPADRASQLANPAFDAAVWELWPSLAAGASVHFPDPALRGDPARLREWMLAEGISVAFAPTPVAERLLALDWPADAALRLLLTGGDVLHRRPPAGLPFRLVNNYGPTEATVVATSGFVVPASSLAGGLPSIGSPIDGVEALVLDERGELCPDGEPGELCLAGAGLARGYVGGTARHPGGFAPHPFRGGERMYRTGDRVRRRHDGRLEFLGRLDGQVKIRGFRVEPAEIEAALETHPDVRSSLAVAKTERDGEVRLVAYVVSEEGRRPADLREHLRSRLPEYMVPSVFVTIDEFPLTSHGKIDREALPAPPRETPGASAGRPPGSTAEARVAKIAAELLRLDRIGVDENFFSLGGHSLLGTQMIARVRDAFGIELPLRTIFEAPTVSRLAAEVEKAVRRRVDEMSEEEARRIAGAGEGA
ncbi:MAG TPA: non-ribosomal peptide synthetase [Thermoanaerobaculia bacterium]|nr:non-ribosomal peptide synthetase [Thermoanaerobaculia bacterium]